MRIPVFFILLASWCCVGPICQSTQAADNGPQPPKFRLPTSAGPQHYSLNLTAVPDKDTFAGAVDIDLNFRETSSVLWLNAEKITVTDATLTLNGQTLTAKVIPQPKDLVGFSFDHPVGPGTAKLHINYQGEISRKDRAGIFQVKDGDHWYIYSQFEDISARRAFPCFDEPGYKVPWQVTLNVPSDDGAFDRRAGEHRGCLEESLSRICGDAQPGHELSHHLTDGQDQDAARVDEQGRRFRHLQNATLRAHLEAGPECGGGRCRTELEQWSGGRTHQSAEDNQAPDVWPCRI